MNKDAILAWAKEKMLHHGEDPLEPGYRWYHGLRTANLACHLAKAMQLNVSMDALYIGGLLHDVGKAGYKGDKPHGLRGAELIEQEIGHLFSEEQLRQVMEIVARHYQRPKSKYWSHKSIPSLTTEILLVQDADILDHVGVNGIWINFSHSSAAKKNQEDTICQFYQRGARWHEDMLRILNYPLSMQEMEYRLALTHRIFAQWRREEQGRLTCEQEYKS